MASQIKDNIAEAIVDPAGCFNLRLAKPGSEVSLSVFNLLRSHMQDLFVFRSFCDDSCCLISS